LTRGERHGGSGAKDGEASLLGEVLAMGRGTCLVKRRGRGDGTGAEDRESRAERVRSDAVNRGGVSRPSGEWGNSGQGVRLRFGAHELLRRYEPIYPIQSIHCSYGYGRDRRGGGPGSHPKQRCGGETAGPEVTLSETYTHAALA
jgi:hypothetical protein